MHSGEPSSLVEMHPQTGSTAWLLHTCVYYIQLSKKVGQLISVGDFLQGFRILSQPFRRRGLVSCVSHLEWYFLHTSLPSRARPRYSKSIGLVLGYFVYSTQALRASSTYHVFYLETFTIYPRSQFLYAENSINCSHCAADLISMSHSSCISETTCPLPLCVFI